MRLTLDPLQLHLADTMPPRPGMTSEKSFGLQCCLASLRDKSKTFTTQLLDAIVKKLPHTSMLIGYPSVSVKLSNCFDVPWKEEKSIHNNEFVIHRCTNHFISVQITIVQH